MEKRRIVVIGGLSAGPSAAAKARRTDEQAEILLFEKTADISYATCGIPYALSGIIDSREKLLITDVEKLKKRFNINVHLHEEVLGIDPENQTILTSRGSYDYDKLIFATGARPFIPAIANLAETDNWATCRSLSDFDRIAEGALKETVKHVTVMGAGLIGIEVAENLRHLGKEVTVIEGGDQILPMWDKKFSAFAEDILNQQGIEVIKTTFVKEVDVQENKVIGITLPDGSSLSTDYVILSVGIKPNTEMLSRLGAKTLKNGALIVDEHMETSLANIYAAGDNASIKNRLTDESDYLPLGTHSNKGGRAAGFNAAAINGQNMDLGSAYKTAIIKVFDYTLGRTGLGPAELVKRGIPFKRTLTVTGSTPEYFPNQKDIVIETYYHAEDHHLLGAELFGEFGVDKRTDVLSTAVFAKLKVEDLARLDLAYAPPYAPAKDVVTINGMMAQNASLGLYKEVGVDELNAKMEAGEELQIVDVRTDKERAQNQIPGSIHIPVDSLRERMDALDPHKKTILTCQKGMRGYIAYRILDQNGFRNLYNLAGGMSVWSRYNRVCPLEEGALDLMEELN